MNVKTLSLCVALATFATTSVSAQEPETDYKALERDARAIQKSLGKPKVVPFQVHSTATSIRAKSASDIFKWVKKNVNFQPYSGELRGARGVLIDSTGNSVDQTLLLAELLQHRGYNVRFVRGRYTNTQVDELLRAFAGTASLINPRDLGGEKVLHDALTLPRYTTLLDHHVWLEVEVKGAWIAADPVFNQDLGPSPVDVLQRSSELWDDLRAKINIEFEATLKDGQVKKMGGYDGLLSPIAYSDIAITFEPDVRLEHAIRPLVSVGGQIQVNDYLPRNEITHLRVKIHTRRGRLESRHIETLVSPTDARSAFSYEQAYFGISFFTGNVPSSYALEASRVALEMGSDSLQAMASARQNEPALELPPFLNRAHQSLPHAIATAHLAHFDRLTEELAFSMGTRVFNTEPRILSTALLRDGGDYALRMSVQQPGLESMPRQGVPVAAATGLLTLVGYLEADLESRIIERLSARPLLTMGDFFGQAWAQNVPLMTIDRTNLSQVSKLGWQRSRADRIREQISRRGHVVVVPPKGVTIGNRNFQGWWALQPSTGVLSGSIGDGLLSAANEDAKSVALGTSTLELMKSVLVLADTTEDTTAYISLVCNARQNVSRLMTTFCAKQEPLTLPKADVCLTEVTSSDNLMGTCEERTAGTRCGASVASALLSGELTVMYSDEETKNARERHKGKAFGLSCR